MLSGELDHTYHLECCLGETDQDLPQFQSYYHLQMLHIYLSGFLNVQLISDAPFRNMDKYYFNKKFLLHYICIHDYLKTIFGISCLSSLNLLIQIRQMVWCTRCNFMQYNLSVTCGRSVVFSGYIGFLHQ
jgi:hypothetical protein